MSYCFWIRCYLRNSCAIEEPPLLLIYLRHLIRLKAVTNLMLFPKNPIFLQCVRTCSELPSHIRTMLGTGRRSCTPGPATRPDSICPPTWDSRQPFMMKTEKQKNKSAKIKKKWLQVTFCEFSSSPIVTLRFTNWILQA